MFSPTEFALLFAVATPIAILVAMNVFLAMEGERDTLILPAWGNPAGRAEGPLMDGAAANDARYRRAA